MWLVKSKDHKHQVCGTGGADEPRIRSSGDLSLNHYLALAEIRLRAACGDGSSSTEMKLMGKEDAQFA